MHGGDDQDFAVEAHGRIGIASFQRRAHRRQDHGRPVGRAFDAGRIGKLPRRAGHRSSNSVSSRGS